MEIAVQTSSGASAPRAAAELIPFAYDDLRALARDLLRRHRRPEASRATSLAHEVYARLVRGDARYSDAGHLLRTAARAMRFVLVDEWRRRRAERRGGGAEASSRGPDAAPAPRPGVDVEAVHEAIGRLAAFDRQKADVVELRFFGGLSVDETAGALGVSPATVKREWALAKAWLYRELGPR